MDFVRLTEKQRQVFEEDGYLIVRKAIDAETVAILAKSGDQLMESFEYDGFYAHRRHGVVQEEPFLSLVSNSSTVPLIIQLLGTNIHITNTALIYKHPQGETLVSERNWHRDVGVHLDLGHNDLPRVGLKIGYCLTDCMEPNSGSTLFVEGSNNLAQPLAIPAEQTDPKEFHEPFLKAGDAFLFESRTYHAPALNFTNSIAKSIIYGYHYRWIKPDYYLRYYNGKQQPVQDLLEKMDDVTRQLLGACTDTAGRTAPDGIEWPIREWSENYNIALKQSPQVDKK